ncbi:MAG: hypothetical protein Q8N63_06040 [Nanoarchaeota archaeon]|nr:hypothetical protein [Nanoarchaeota archaeon]
MIKTAEKDQHIKNTSQELAVEALRTLPIIPSYGFFKFFANGIQEPEWSRIEKEELADKNRYTSECSKAKVIPFSRIKFEYDWDKKIFVPETSFHDSIIPHENEFIMALLDGGKIHKINLETSQHKYGGFDFFRQNFLQTLINKKYQIGEINLWLTHFHSTGYEAGDSPDSTLAFKTDTSKKGLILHLGSEVSEDTEKLESWFKNLRAYQD